MDTEPRHTDTAFAVTGGTDYATWINDGEGNDTTTGTIYIYDGTHKSPVLSTLFFDEDANFQPVDAILLRPPR